ncbi:MAG: helix-turn-helix transcriptional regulator [Elusimicrobia bacterium]|nr:helix-turn-helix transcriptional regulator [Elusimicrobiota bacterium]
MSNKIKEFLKEINNGKIRGSRKIIADALGINETAISKWSKGRTQPSKENISKMAKIFKKSQSELEEIFSSNIFIKDEDIYLILEENKKLKKELEIRDDLIKLLKDKIKVFENKK